VPSAYHIFPDSNLLLVRYWGKLQAHCVLRLIDALEEDPGYRDGMNEFDDLRDVTEVAISPSELERMVNLVAGVNLRSPLPRKKALIATGPVVLQAAGVYSNLLQTQSNVIPCVFSDVEEAIRFLSLENTLVARQLIDPNALS